MNKLFGQLMLGGSTAALLAAMPFGVRAQGNDIEQVVVSASRVSIAGYTQPTPVTVVGAAQLEKDAFANIADAVRELPQVTSPPASYGTNPESGSPGQLGLNLINLRNLGNTRTLILFDNQRVVVSNLTGGVDVNTLPSAIVSRVDIVTGGASAAWGSDAVAGVVNFVINKNFNGWKSSVEGSDTYNNLNRTVKVSTAWGGDIFGGRGHLVLAATANLHPDFTLMVNENWFRGAYWVSNPSYAAGNGQPQLIVANNVGLAGGNTGGIITTSPAVTAANSPSGAAVAANALRGIGFVGAGIPQLVNYGNVTLGALSNGGSLTAYDGDMPFQAISPTSSTYTFFAFGRYKLTDTIQLSMQLNAGYFTGKGTAQSFQQLNTSGATIKSDNAFIPASVRATIQSTGITSFQLGTINTNLYNNYIATGSNFTAQSEAGFSPFITFDHRILQRGVITLDGTLGNDWSWTAYAQHSDVRFYVHEVGNAIEANLENAVDAVTVTTANRGNTGLPLGSVACRSTLSGTPFVFGSVTAQAGCIPADIFGQGTVSHNAVAYIGGGAQDFEDMHTQQDVVEASMQGTLPWQLPAGPVAVAFGAGYRKEAGSNRATQIGAQAGYAVGNWTNFPSSSYNVMEGFLEVDAPVIKHGFVDSLDVSAAGRMTSYSTSGLVETWKLGATSQVNDDIKLRTTWSVDIRAPQLTDLFTPGSVNTGTARDPKTQSTVAIFSVGTGNPNLNPEVARTVSGGVVLTPSFLEGFSMSADWYSINLTGGLGTISAAAILSQCNAQLASTLYPGTNGNPNDPLCAQHLVFAGPNGALSSTTSFTINIADQTTSGLDLQANYTMDFWDGSLAWTSYANLTDENTTNQIGSGITDSAGSGGTPKWKGVLSADYTTGPVSFTVQGRWYGTSVMSTKGNTGNQSTAATANLYDPAHFEVPFTAYLDLRGSYKWNDNIEFYGAIDNFTNVPPALIPPDSTKTQADGTIIATNATTYDMLGRTFRLGVRFNY